MPYDRYKVLIRCTNLWMGGNCCNSSWNDTHHHHKINAQYKMLIYSPTYVTAVDAISSKRKLHIKRISHAVRTDDLFEGLSDDSDDEDTTTYIRVNGLRYPLERNGMYNIILQSIKQYLRNFEQKYRKLKRNARVIVCVVPEIIKISFICLEMYQGNNCYGDAEMGLENFAVVIKVPPKYNYVPVVITRTRSDTGGGDTGSYTVQAEITIPVHSRIITYQYEKTFRDAMPSRIILLVLYENI